MFSGNVTGGTFTGLPIGIGFTAGEVLTLTITVSGGGISLGLFDGVSTLVSPGTVSFSYTVPATTAGILALFGSFGFGADSASWSCAAGGAAARSTPIVQTINNANTAIQNGQQTLQNFSDWISRGVQTSFSPSGNSTNSAAARRLAPLSARAKVLKLQQDEQALVEDMASRPDGGDELARGLAAVRRDLMYARATAEIASVSTSGTSREMKSSLVPERERTAMTESLQVRQRLAETRMTPAQESTQVYDGPVGSAPASSRPAPSLSVGTRDLEEFCDSECQVVGKQWNVWLEGRAIGATDSLAQNSSLGFVGSTGVDYKVLPWLAVGLSVGAETFETRFGTQGVRSGSVGVSAIPYVGIRLHDNIYASAFVGLTKINYDTNPGAGINAHFNGLRTLVGGALTGVWRNGPWRFQPTLSGTYGTETQDAYTDSASNAVASQTVSYGRVSAGPEVATPSASRSRACLWSRSCWPRPISTWPRPTRCCSTASRWCCGRARSGRAAPAAASTCASTAVTTCASRRATTRSASAASTSGRA